MTKSFLVHRDYWSFFYFRDLRNELDLSEDSDDETRRSHHITSNL